MCLAVHQWLLDCWNPQASTIQKCSQKRAYQGREVLGPKKKSLFQGKTILGVKSGDTR